MKKPYQRLPGRRWLTAGLMHKLWLGSDHLLAVTGSRYNETYQRFDYRDIQALISRRTRRRLAIGLALGIPAALILLAGATGGWSGIAVSLGFSGPLLLGVAVNALRGPTCVSHVRTAVSVVELPSLARTRSFERAVRILRPRIEAAQESLTGEALEEGMARMPAPGPAQPLAAVPRPAPRLRPYRGAAHEMLFSLLIVLGLLGLLRGAVGSTALSVAGGAAFLAFVGALVVSLVRQQDTDLSPAVRGVAWSAAAYLTVSFTLLYLTMAIEIVLTDPAGQPDAILRFFDAGPDTPTGLLVLALSLTAIGIGIVGWLRMRAFRAARLAGDRRAPRAVRP